MFTSALVLSRSSHLKFIIDYENIPANTCQIHFFLNYYLFYFLAASCGFTPCPVL